MVEIYNDSTQEKVKVETAEEMAAVIKKALAQASSWEYLRSIDVSDDCTKVTLSFDEGNYGEDI